ncbi:M9 family metallopeptidase [Streptomyces sp. NPDC089919]|uniref:M9 family metallopeptidase n=1 Tax=Streptomyces sp. NPDC089919 TaxID=3155188 RepID=UPI003448D09E
MRSSPTMRDLARLLISALTLCLGLALLAPGGPAAAAPAGSPRPVPAPRPAPAPRPGAGPLAATATEAAAALAPATSPARGGGSRTRSADLRPPLDSAKAALHFATDRGAGRGKSSSNASAAVPSAAAAAACRLSDFTSKTGSALVQQIKAVDTDCINTLFSVTGNDSKSLFREAQMVTVANALRDTAAGYPGNNSTSAAQVVLYLRAGYYVQYGQPGTVGTYGTALQSAIRGGLDAFYAAGHAFDVTDANGQTLAEAVTLIDSAGENARYLWVVKRLLAGYNSAYDASWWMVAAVNNTYTVLFRGHQVPAFVTAVQADPSVLTTMRDFAVNHDDLLGTDKGYLAANAGRELGRFLKETPLQATVRPMAKQLLGRSTITGRTAALWTGVAEMADSYDKANCSYYGTCDLANRVRLAVLTLSYTCAPTLHIVAQEMTTAQLAASCTSMLNQNAYFHGVVKDNGPVANDRNTNLEVAVFDSSTDYKMYAGIIYGIDTDNGGMYEEGNDPSSADNQPRFIAHEAEWLRPDFQIWNLNHEYTHYLDGRFDMYGNFDAGMTTPTVMWVEGFAEYISYSYRNVVYTEAQTEAGRNTYRLSQLFDTTYDNSDSTRVYRWGYLAVRYLLQSHPQDVTTLLGYYRTGNWAAARTLLTSTIGTRYDADFASWLTRCAAGDCGVPAGLPECTATDSRELGKNCRRSNLSATTGNYAYLFVKVPAGTTSLKITVAGGTGDADLYYSASNWATTGSYTSRSVHAGTNAETLTVASPPSGYVYVSLYAAAGFGGASVSTEF